MEREGRRLKIGREPERKREGEKEGGGERRARERLGRWVIA